MHILPMLICLAAAFQTSSVIAGSCGPIKEYAQYKDKASTAKGRDSLAIEYCLNSRLHKIAADYGRIRDMEECSTTTSKIMDALSATNDQRAIKRALGGCSDVFDKKDGKQSAPPSMYKCLDSNGSIAYSTRACETEGMTPFK